MSLRIEPHNSKQTQNSALRAMNPSFTHVFKHSVQQHKPIRTNKHIHTYINMQKITNMLSLLPAAAANGCKHWNTS
jgi:hypothetical protein